MRRRFRDDLPEEGTLPSFQSASGKKRKRTDARIPHGLPDRFFNEEGEVDLSQVTGDDAYKYFAAQGMQLPIFPRADGK